MSEGWEIKKLGEVCHYAKNQGLYNDLPYIGMEDIVPSNNITTASRLPRIVKSATFKFQSGMVLFGRLRPYLRKVIVADYEGHCSTEIFPIETTNAISPYFLRYWFSLDKTVEKINETCTGARMPRANMNEVLNFELPIPPVDEQQRIVATIDREFAKIEQIKANATQNLANAKALFQATLTSALTPKEGWTIKKLGDVCTIAPAKKGVYSIIEDGDTTVSFLPMEDLGINNKFVRPIKTRPFREVVKGYTYFAEDDILLAKVTPCFENGKIGIAKGLQNGVGFGSSEYIVVRANTNVVSNEYIYYALSSTEFRSVGKHLMTGACGLKRLPKDYVGNFEIPIPPISEQQAIVAKLDALSERCTQIEQNYTTVIAECEALKQAILKQAFNGEI